MARAGMLQRGGKNGAEGCDDVQRSLELLDQVLSEYDEGEPRSLEARAVATPATPATSATDDDSPLAGHTSEDDGYMSMNGRRAKFALGFRPTEEHDESPPEPPSPHSPPPPEEAQRIISTLLPKVSPANSAKRMPSVQQKEAEERLDSIISTKGTTTTQTTFPKTRHQRPYGWEKDSESEFQLAPAPQGPIRFSSLQHGARHPPDGNWLPPRNPVKSPSVENAPIFPFMGFSTEFGDKPYNEHPVTIYPGPNIQYSRQAHSPTYHIQRISPSNTNKNLERKNPRIDTRSDGELLSPKTKIPPRTLAGSMERHREVCRGSSEDLMRNSQVRTSSQSNDEEHFSDDSLEESFPPPPPVATTPSKRNSIAWEVSLDGDDPLLTPGSTKVIGRRRRKSGDNSHSSTSSIPQRVEEDWGEEYWPPPPAPCLPLASPPSDTDSDARRDACGTYVIRKGKNRKQLPSFNKTANANSKSNLLDNHSLNRSTDKSFEGSSVSISGSGSVGSYNSRPSSDLSLTQSRYSADLNSRLSRELNTPNSRFSIDLCTPNSRLSKELTSPKSRLSLDLNNGQDRYISPEYFGHSPKSRKVPSDAPALSKPVVQSKLSPQNRFTDFKKYSSTFDNIQSLIKEGRVEETPATDCNETVADLASVPPHMVRVVSLPTLGVEGEGGVSATAGAAGVGVAGAGAGVAGAGSAPRAALITTVEEEEDGDSAEHASSGDTSPLRKIENNINAILSQGRDQKHFTPYIPKDWNIHKDEYCDDVSKDMLVNNYRFSSRERPKRHDIQKSSSHNEIQTQRSMERRDRSSGRRSNSMHKSTSAKDVPVSLMRQPSSSDSAVSSGGDFPLNVQIVEHSYRLHPLPLPPSPSIGHERGPLPLTPESPKFPPLPPSPVQEVEDEYTEIVQHPLEKRHMKKSDTLPTPTLDSRRRPSEPPAVPPHRDTTNSLKTRSMEAAYNKNRRSSTNFKTGSTDRRTLPTDMTASGARRRTLQRQRDSGRAALQTSASLPETPVFARGCDLPRTPPRNATGPPRNNTLNSIQSIGSSATLGGYGRGSVVGPAAGVCTGADLLRMGGPARGWYPRQRNRPASIEHLDRLTVTKMSADASAAWDATASRKPLTLPPNLTPKFFQKSPREALRRVTSLLIRKGNNGKEKDNTRNKEATSPAARSANGDEHPGQKQRKGFFRSFWKKSRHYSLEHP